MAALDAFSVPGGPPVNFGLELFENCAALFVDLLPRLLGAWPHRPHEVNEMHLHTFGGAWVDAVIPWLVEKSLSRGMSFAGRQLVPHLHLPEASTFADTRRSAELVKFQSTTGIDARAKLHSLERDARVITNRYKSLHSSYRAAAPVLKVLLVYVRRPVSEGFQGMRPRPYLPGSPGYSDASFIGYPVGHVARLWDAAINAKVKVVLPLDSSVLGG